jgi:uncharacterized protein YbcI
MAEMAIAAIAIAAITVAAIAIALHCAVSERHHAEAFMEAARMQLQDPTRRDGAGLREEITRSVVRLHKEYIGQGPTKARTYIDEDLIVCVLQGGFSRAERTLFEHGRPGAVIHQRQALDEALRQPLTDMIERVVERTVVGFISAMQPDGELSTLVFLLKPAASADSAASRLLTPA